MKLWVDFREYKWKDSALDVVNFTAVTEYVILFTMSMQIKTRFNFIAKVDKVSYLIFYGEYLWM
jgi:hypothetical protein